jgi:sulfatase modifying factor 1
MNPTALLRAACILLLSAFTLHAEVPNLINYQGRLTDSQGNPVTGNRTMAVRVYDAPTGGNMTYEQNIGIVAVANGTYSFQFGSGGDGVVGVLTGSDYLALSVNGTEESARTRLLAVPYALKSADAQALRAELVELGVIPVTSSGNMVTVQGGTLATSNELNGTLVSAFKIGKYEVTWAEWQEVRDWAVANGYSDLGNVGAGSAGDHPVGYVNWYDVLKWMNAKSEKEGLGPVYSVNGTVYRSGEFGWDGSTVVTRNLSANGYRLPTEVEWEWAARGGVSSQNYTYSGSNDVGVVAWSDENPGGGTKVVGTKAANELGIHDMSGNVWEWCEDLASGSYRRLRGGGWASIASYAAVAHRDFYFYPDIRYFDFGFRLARSSGL